MPNDVKNQSTKLQQDATNKSIAAQKEKEYQQCLTATKNDTAYCTCVKNGGVKLNTNVPFVGKCINKDGTGTGSTTSTAFSDLIGGLSKMVVTAILIVSFMFVII